MMSVELGPPTTMVGVQPGERPCEPRRRGRPRSAGIDAALLTATLDLAAEVGISRLSMDELAERAGVSKGTIYRRWSSKEELVIDALRSAMRPLDDVDTGALRTDLELYLGELAGRFRVGQMNDVLPHLIEVACHDDAIRSSLDDYVQNRRQPLRVIFEHAVVRGELGGDVDIETLIDVVIGPFVYRRLLTRSEIDDAYIERLLAIVLPGD
jgi:AcrR family transcriptional regulator